MSNGETDKRAKRPFTRRSRLLEVRCTRCGVLSHQLKTTYNNTLLNYALSKYM